MVTDILPAASVVRGDAQAAVEAHADGLRLTVDGPDAGTALTIRLGITLGGVDLACSSTLLRSSIRTVADSLTAVSGKATGPWAFEHEELTATLRHESGLEWRVVVRLAADGFALRYDVPDLQGVSTLDAEGTSFPLDGFDRAWVLDYQTWYETPRIGVDVAELAAGTTASPSSSAPPAESTSSSPNPASMAGSAERTRSSKAQAKRMRIRMPARTGGHQSSASRPPTHAPKSLAAHSPPGGSS